MIKFFRKMRYNLMEKNKTGKYLKYALGEIILVVIGILIALQINTWNQSRKQAIAEKEFIEGVKNDLKQDKAYMKLVADLFEPRIQAYHLLNKDLPKLYNEDRVAMDSLFQIYFISQRTFYPISGSFQAAISGNEINTYKNKKATQAIIRLYNSTYERLIDNAEMVDDRWSFLSKKYSYERRTGHLREMNSERISELLDDVYHHYVQMQWYKNMLIETIAEIELLLQLD